MAVQGEFHQVASDTKSPCGLNQGHKYPPADGGIQNSQRDTGNQLLTTRIRFRLQKKNTQVPVNTKAIFIEPKLYRSTLLFFTSFPIIIINKRQKKYRKAIGVKTTQEKVGPLSFYIGNVIVRNPRTTFFRHNFAT